MADKHDERIQNMLDWYKSNKENYKKFSRLVLSKTLNALKERNIQIAYSSYREKNLTSLENKCRKKIYDDNKKTDVLKYTDPKNEIMDFAGVRIVTYLKSDIPLIKNVIENLFCVDQKNSVDKIDELSENEIGYLSTHYIVSLKEVSFDETKFKNFKCEIQIRTVLQDAWSQIFHDRQYKAGFNGFVPSNEINRKTNLIAGSLELIDDQIDDLVRQYDLMNSKMTKEVNFQKILDLKISQSSLSEYCRIKFKDRVNRYYSAKTTLSILNKYELVHIRDIDNIVPINFADAIMKSDQVTIDKLISYILIIQNPEKYFSLLGDNYIKTISHKSTEILDGFVDIHNICEKHNVTIE